MVGRGQEEERKWTAPTSPCTRLIFTESNHHSKDVERRYGTQGGEVAELRAGSQLPIKLSCSILQLLEFFLSSEDFLYSDFSLFYCKLNLSTLSVLRGSEEGEMSMAQGTTATPSLSTREGQGLGPRVKPEKAPSSQGLRTQLLSSFEPQIAP